MANFLYSIRKAGSNCSGVNFYIIKWCGTDASFGESYYVGTTAFYDTTKRTFTAARQKIHDLLSPMNANSPSNFCVTDTFVYNTDFNGLEITFDGTDYYHGNELIGPTLHDDLLPYYATEKHRKEASPSYFEAFNSKNLSYQSKRKRKRASQSFT